MGIYLRIKDCLKAARIRRKMLIEKKLDALMIKRSKSLWGLRNVRKRHKINEKYFTQFERLEEELWKVKKKIGEES